MERKSLREVLAQCSEEVNSWPAWKQQLLHGHWTKKNLVVYQIMVARITESTEYGRKTIPEELRVYEYMEDQMYLSKEKALDMADLFACDVDFTSHYKVVEVLVDESR